MTWKEVKREIKNWNLSDEEIKRLIQLYKEKRSESLTPPPSKHS